MNKCKYTFEIKNNKHDLVNHLEMIVGKCHIINFTHAQTKIRYTVVLNVILLFM